MGVFSIISMAVFLFSFAIITPMKWAFFGFFVQFSRNFDEILQKNDEILHKGFMQ